jgi:PAS domain S-box-containing protein
MLPPALIELDDDGRCRRASASTAAWFGAPAEHLVGLRLRDVLGPEPYGVVNTFAEAARTTRVAQTVEMQLSPGGAGMRNVEATFIPTEAGLELALVDLTARKRTEQEVRRRLSLLEDFIENGSEGLHWVGRDGAILWANKAELDLLGYTADEYVGHHIAEFHVDPPVIEDILCRLAGKETLHGYEARLRAKDGSIKHVLINSSVYWEGDSFVHTRCFTRDITDRRAVEADREELLRRERAARDEAERASRLKDEFLTTLSHELRTPLNAIVGWTHILQAGANEATTKRAVEVIHRNAAHQAQLIADILDTQRLAAGKVRLNLQAVDLTTAIAAAVESVKPAALAKGIDVVPVLDTETGPILGDPDRLQQILWNLLSNAVKFTPRDGRVRVSLARINSHVEITVEDTGPGIDPEFLPYVFQRFRQGDSSSSRRHGGLGLGLAIVRDLVELHGGQIAAANRSTGSGALFTVTLPRMSARPVPALEQPPEGQPEAGAGRPRWLSDAPSLSGLRVLIVDDLPEAREVVAALLARCGADVVAASSSAEALALTGSMKPDVIVCDIEMPGENGYEFVRRLRTLPPEQGGATPAVALTAYAGSDDRLLALSKGFQMHVAKPVEPVELAVVIASLRSRRS